MARRPARWAWGTGAHGVLTWSACGPAAVIGFIDDPVRTFRPACLKALTAPASTTTAAEGP